MPGLAFVLHVFLVGPAIVFSLGVVGWVEGRGGASWVPFACAALALAYVRHISRTGLAKEIRLGDDGAVVLELRRGPMSFGPDDVKRVGRIWSSPWMPVPGHAILGSDAILVESSMPRLVGPFRWVVPVEARDEFLARLDDAGFSVEKDRNIW